MVVSAGAVAVPALQGGEKLADASVGVDVVLNVDCNLVSAAATPQEIRCTYTITNVGDAASDTGVYFSSGGTESTWSAIEQTNGWNCTQLGHIECTYPGPLAPGATTPPVVARATVNPFRPCPVVAAIVTDLASAADSGSGGHGNWVMTNVDVPCPVDPLCTGRLLTMGWLDGRPLMQVLDEDPPQEERNRIAAALFTAWYRPLYRYGVIHGDPHPGNYQVRAADAPGGGDLNLLDFGVIRVFQPHFIAGVIALYEAVRDKDAAKARHAYETWGFPGLSDEQIEVLNQWAEFLYEPLLEDRVRPIQSSPDPDHGRKVVARVHAGLKRTGGVKPPREFVLMDRAAIGLGAVFLRLRAELNWHRMFHALIDDFSTHGLAARQQAALQQAGVPQAA